MPSRSRTRRRSPKKTMIKSRSPKRRSPKRSKRRSPKRSKRRSPKRKSPKRRKSTKRSKRRSPKRKSPKRKSPKRRKSPHPTIGCACGMSPQSMPPLNKDELEKFVKIYTNLKDPQVTGITREKWEVFKRFSLHDLTYESINNSILNMETKIKNKDLRQNFCDLYSKNFSKVSDTQKEYHLDCVRMKILLMLEQMKLDKMYE